MTNGINNVSGYGNYGVGPYLPNRKDNNNVEHQEQQQVPVQNFEETQVDPSKVMDFLAANNFFVAPAETTTPIAEVDVATQARVEGYMENFEMIYGVIVEEFGEELAPDVMDIAMDYLMGMAA